MLVIGLVLLASAVALSLLAWSNTARTRRLAMTENLTPAQLVRLHSDILADADVAGAFVHEVDAEGFARCTSPLSAPLSSTPCVYFTTHVTARLEQRRVSTDSHGNSSEHWESSQRVVSGHEQIAAFELHDGGASLPVFAGGAQIDGAVTTVDRFEPSNGNGDGSDSPIGDHAVNGDADGERLLGYQHVERIVPVEARLFVHGSVDDSTGRLAFRPADGRPLMISTRSEADIAIGALKNARWEHVTAITFGAVGALAIVVWLFSG